MRLRTTARMGIRTSRNAAPLPPVVGPLLDGVAHTALAAFSLRRLRAAYTGPALRVRRASDNTTLDVGFTGAGVLNTAALLTFTGTSNGHVVTWYDQTGNGNNITNATAANQPLVASAGAMAPQGVTFSGAQDLLGATAVTASALAAVMQFNTDANQYVMGAGDAGNIIIFRLGGGVLRVGAATTASELADFPDSTIGTPVQMYAAGTFREPFLFRNGAAVTRGPLTPLGSFSPVLSLGSRRIGGASPAYFSGAFQEAIFFANGLADDERTRLSRNQGTAFGIAVP